MADVPEKIAEVFGRAAFDYDTVIPFFRSFGARLVEVAALQPGEKVLDVGAGRGATLFPAAERVGPDGSVLGVDLSAEMVLLLTAEVQQRGVTNASVQRMDAGELDVPAESFDVVLSSFVLHLLPDPDQAAACFARALRPGGRCAAVAPHPGSPEWHFLHPLLVSFVGRATRPPVVPFRPDFDVALVLAKAGLDVTYAADEELEFRFADEQMWWDWAWSAGMRDLLETLAPEDLEELRAQLFAELASRKTADGIAMRQRADFVVARKG